MLQDLLNSCAPLGIEVILEVGTYLVSQELSIPSSATGGRLRGQGHAYTSDVTTIKATASMRSVLAVLASFQHISDLKIDADSQATSGLYLQSASLGRFENVWAWNAVVDGWYLDGDDTDFVDSSQFVNCGGISNGKCYATSGISGEYARVTSASGTVATTAGSATLTFTSAPNLTTLGIRKGDFIRVGKGSLTTLSSLVSVGTVATATTAANHGLADQQIVTISGASPAAYNGAHTITVISPTQFQYTFAGGSSPATGTITVSNPQTAQFIQIEAVLSASTLSVQGNAQNLPTQTVSGADYAIGVGDGYHDHRESDSSHHGFNNNTNTITGGLWRGNAGSAIVFAGLFGSTVIGPQIDFNNFFGIVLGFSDNASGTFQATLVRPYFEGLIAGGVWFGQTFDAVVLSPTWANSLYPHRGIYMNQGWILGSGLTSLLSGQWQNFVIEFQNNSGTLQHRIIAEHNSAFASVWADRINGATASWTTTPIVSSSNAFQGGAGLLTGATNIVVFDVTEQIDPGRLAITAMVEEQSGPASILRCRADLISANVNGVTLNRIALYIATGTGTPTGIDTTNLLTANGQYLSIRVSGYIR